MIQTAEDKVKEYCQCIRREIEHWKVINQNGFSFIPRGFQRVIKPKMKT